jgi:hypothetical protein
VGKTATVTGTSWTAASLTTADIATLGMGSIAVSVRQTVGGVVSNPTVGNITIDTSFAPSTSVVISTIAGDDILDGTESLPAISGTATSGATVSVTLTNQVSGASVSLTPVTATNGNWTTAVLTSSQRTALGGDNQSLVVKATQVNTDGTTSIASRTITIDTLGPSAPGASALVADASTLVASDSGLADSITTVTTPTFSGKANLGATVNLYQGTTLIGTGTADATTGIWTIKSSTLTDNTYAITAKQEDAAGNESAASTALALTVDTAVAAPNMGAVATTARYILVKQTGASTNKMYLNEIEVYSGGVNIARTGTVTASSYAVQSGYPASGVKNGTLLRDSSNGYASSADTTDNWLQIDLGASYVIDAVKLYALSEASADILFSRHLDVFASTSSLKV